MPLQDIAKVTISLNTSGVSREGFGTPIFITAHNYFADRVRSYTNSSDVATDMTTGSNGYAAAISLFKNQPSPSTFKIGRLIASSIVAPQGTGTGGAVEVGVIYGLTVTDVNGDTAVATYTTLGGDALSDVVTNLVADINTAAIDVNLVNNGDTFTIERTAAFPTSDFTLSDITTSNIEISGADDGNTENILDCVDAIQDDDNDWYVISWEDHTTKDDILDLADAIEAQEKLYFYGSAVASSITDSFTLGDTPTSNDDILAALANGGYLRTVGWWHQDADTDFNELSFAGYNLPFDAGSVVWGNIQVPVEAAQNASGKALTSTEQNRLADRFSNFAAVKGNIVYVREGKVIGNEWIDIIRGRDNLQSDLEADLFDILVNQQGKKVSYTDKGINVFAGRVRGRLNDYKDNRDFLTDPINVNVPKAANVDTADKLIRTLRDMTFKATLAGAIQLVDLTGELGI